MKNELRYDGHMNRYDYADETGLDALGFSPEQFREFSGVVRPKVESPIIIGKLIFTGSGINGSDIEDFESAKELFKSFKNHWGETECT